MNNGNFEKKRYSKVPTIENPKSALYIKLTFAFTETRSNVAYQQAFHPEITDDASLVEQAGYPIHLVNGNEENIKITSQIDLILAEEIAKI